MCGTLFHLRLVDFRQGSDGKLVPIVETMVYSPPRPDKSDKPRTGEQNDFEIY